MQTAQTFHPRTPTDNAIDIIDIIEESLEISIADLILNRVFVERHFPQHGLYVPGNKKELLLVQSYLIFNAIDAMDGLTLKVLKIMSTINTEANTILITYRTSNRASEHRALNKETRCVPSRKNGYCRWLEIMEKIVERHGGTVAVHNQPGKGLSAVIELPLVGFEDIHPSTCQ